MLFLNSNMHIEIIKRGNRLTVTDIFTSPELFIPYSARKKKELGFYLVLFPLGHKNFFGPFL